MAGLPAAFALDPRALSLTEGVRASLATCVVVLAASWLSQPVLLSAALAAWLTCLADAGGPLRRRIPILVGFVLLGAFFTGALGVLRGSPLPLTILLASACVFCTSFARVWGQPALQAGNLLSIVVVLAVREPIARWQDAIPTMATFLLGGGWAILIALVLWPIYPHLPSRRAVADCYRALAAFTGDLAGLAADPQASPALWESHLRAGRRTVRERIERARSAVLDTATTRGPIGGRTRENLVRVEAADGMFGALIGLSDQLEDGVDAATRHAAVRILRYLRPVLALLGDYVVTAAPSRLERLERIAATMEVLAPSGTPLAAAVVTIVDRVRIATTLAADDAPGSAPFPQAPTPLRQRLVGPVLANLSRDSLVLRHALRVTAASVIAFAVTMTWPTPYEHWLTITLLLTIQPYWALTFTRALERIGGTVLGGAVAAGLLYFFGTTTSLAIAMFPLTMTAFALRTVSFGVFVACVTPIVVLLSEVATAPGNQLQLALMRAAYTILGGTLALGFGYVLWPSWEPDRLLGELSAAIRAHGRYAVSELDAVLGERPPSDIERHRRAAGLASNNLEASLQRLLLEPRSDRRVVQAAMTADAALRRIAGRLSALQFDPGRDHDPTVWRRWRDWIGLSTDALADLRTELTPRPALPAGDAKSDALARLARQLELTATALARLAEPDTVL